MTIITRGTPEADRVARVTCSSCRSVLDVTRGECKYNDDDDLDEPWYNVKCVVCSGNISIKLTEFVIPKPEVKPVTRPLYGNGYTPTNPCYDR